MWSPASRSRMRAGALTADAVALVGVALSFTCNNSVFWGEG